MIRLRLLVLLVTLTGCATKFPVQGADPGKLSEEQARSIVGNALRRFDSGMPVEFRRKEIVIKPTGMKSEVRIPLDGQISSFECQPIDGCIVWVRASGTQQNAWMMRTSNDPAKMQPIVAAFNELVARNVYAERLDQDFAAKAEAWRASGRRELSPEANKRRILAENAFREKNVALAIEHYEAALESDPMWPDGTFNLALLYGETGEYKQAARFMKRYLLLVPDSKDGKAAEEKIVIWEDKATRATP